MSVKSYLLVVSCIPLLNFHVLHKRQSDVSYGSPAYKYCVCGVKNERTPENDRIIGGNETIGNEYPWMAVIVIEGRIPQLICGGSLINDRYVLSAAHCLRVKYAQSQMKVVLGEHDICQSDVRVVKFSIEKFIQHPSYKASRRLIADIMLVKLNMRVTFNQYIRPVCLPKEVARVNTEARYAGRTGYVLGWGVGDSDNTSCVLRKTSLVVYKPGTCAFTAFRVFCAGYPEGKHDVCSGDSGGPFQVINAQGRYELIGIVSSGIACGDEESPGLYSDVLFALPWIYEEAYRDSMFCWR